MSALGRVAYLVDLLVGYWVYESVVEWVVWLEYYSDLHAVVWLVVQLV